MVKFKKMLVGISVCALSFGLSVGHLSANENSVVTVNASNVNLRSGPSLSHQVVELLQNGNKLTVLAHEGKWYKVSAPDNVIGWIVSDYISSTDSSTGTITGSNVNLRSDSNTSGNVIGTLQKGDKLDILTQGENWYKVKTSDGTVGWVSKDFVSLTGAVNTDTSSTAGIVTGSNVNLRSDSSLSSKIIGTLQKNNNLEILAQSDNWYKIKTSSNVIGWVSKDFISLTQDNSRNSDRKLSSRSETTRVSSEHDEIVAYAKQFLDVRYVWAGNTPSGFDCSGFTKYVFRKFGIDLNRVAADQATQGAYVGKSNLSPGDLVFFDTNGGHNYINHVGIYIGGGEFIQASSGAGRVVISSINEGFYANTYMTARRVLN